MQKLGQVGGSQGAASGLANLLAGVAQGLTGMVTAIRPYIPAINQFLTAVVTSSPRSGRLLAVIVGRVADALGPLFRYLDKHPNGTVVKIIGDIIAGLVDVQGMQKILPNFITGPLGDAAKAYGGWVKEIVAGAGRKIGAAFKAGWGAISGFGSKLGGMMSDAASSIAGFVSTVASKLAAAAVATGTWIAEHAVATATFIAQNIAQAASATAAYIAENAATLGIIAGITLLVAAIVWMATHWHETWDTIKSVALDLWHNVLDPMWQGIQTGAEWLYTNGIKPAFDT